MNVFRATKGSLSYKTLPLKFTADSGLVRIWTGNKDPTKEKISISRNDARIGIKISSDSVKIEGLILRCFPGYGIHAISNSHISIRDCYITGSRIGICIGKTNSNSNDNDISHCQITNYPLYSFSNRYRNYQKKHGPDVDTFSFYRDGSCGISCSALNTRIHNCYINEELDGISLQYQSGWNETPNIATEVFNNFIQNCHDDCIEIENWRKYKFLSAHLHNNVFLNGLVLVALSPVLNGNIRIDHNLLLQTRQYGMFKSTVFKWDSPPETHVVQNIKIDHNTIMASDGTPTHGLWWCRAKKFINCKASNNIIRINGIKRWPFQESKNIFSNGSVNFDDTIPWEFDSADTLTDCGAVKTGEKWEFEIVGPEWMREFYPDPPLPNVIKCKDVGRCR